MCFTGMGCQGTKCYTCKRHQRAQKGSDMLFTFWTTELPTDRICRQNHSGNLPFTYSYFNLMNTKFWLFHNFKVKYCPPPCTDLANGRSETGVHWSNSNKGTNSKSRYFWQYDFCSYSKQQDEGNNINGFLKQ